MHMFLSTIGDDGSRQAPPVSAILAAVLRFSLLKTLCVEHFSHKSSINSLQSIFHDINNLHKESTCFFSTTGDDGSRQYMPDAAILAAVLRFSLPKTLCVEHFSNKSSILFAPKLFLCVLNLHKETLCFFPTIGDDGIRQCREYRGVLAAVLRCSLPKTVCVEFFT